MRYRPRIRHRSSSRLPRLGGLGRLQNSERFPRPYRLTRVPSGHPEGYLEGFANIYQEAARAIRAARGKGGKPPKDVIFPTVQDGVEGVAFVEACVKSSKKNGAWTKL